MTFLAINSVCEPLETNKVPSCFTRYPAAVSIGAKSVENALAAIGKRATDNGTRERRRAEIRNTNPDGNPFAICHSSADPHRLVLLSSIVEVMWIHDDVTEEVDHETACKEHDVLAQALEPNLDLSKFKSANPRQKMLASKIREAVDLDPTNAPWMIETLKHYLKTFDNRNDEFKSMEEYMPYRIGNSGYWMSSMFIRWGMNMSLSEEDYASIRDYDIAMGNILGLTNDYFSWNIEKDRPADRVLNAVRVLMKQHNVIAEVAHSMLLGIIVEEESRSAKLKEERLKKPVSNEIMQYFEAIELYVGGSCYWHATAPRYQIFE